MKMPPLIDADAALVTLPPSPRETPVPASMLPSFMIVQVPLGEKMPAPVLVIVTPGLITTGFIYVGESRTIPMVELALMVVIRFPLFICLSKVLRWNLLQFADLLFHRVERLRMRE
jgi:hypothetical protein